MGEEIAVIPLAISHTLFRLKLEHFAISLDVEQFLGDTRLVLRLVPLPLGDNVKVKSISILIPPKLYRLFLKFPTINITLTY